MAISDNITYEIGERKLSAYTTIRRNDTSFLHKMVAMCNFMLCKWILMLEALQLFGVQSLPVLSYIIKSAKFGDNLYFRTVHVVIFILFKPTHSLFLKHIHIHI